MEIILLDNGLIGVGEHSYSLAKNVGAALARKNLRYRVYGMRCMDLSIIAEIGAIPHFSRSLYESESPTPNERRLRSLAALARLASVDLTTPSEWETWNNLNTCFEQDLRLLPEDVWRFDNLVVVPGVSQNQIFGLIRALLARESNERPRVVCQLMFAPNWTPWGQNARLGSRLYRKAFALAKPLIGKTLFFTTENEAIAGLYRKRYGIETQILPIPFGATPAAAVGTGRPRLGFFGYSKCDKGFHLLPRAIAFCQSRGLEADFVIQIQHSGWEPATVATERALQSMEGVRLIEGVLNSVDYKAEISKIDVMLLPYDPIIFGLRGSGIFTESASAGRPVVASAGTFAAKSIERGEAEGEVFKPYDAVPLGAAIARLIPNLPARRARAAVLAKAFAQSHSADAYVDVLLTHAQR
jgi:glycosyltransferase involved in cell wall biosynthesis